MSRGYSRNSSCAERAEKERKHDEEERDRSQREWEEVKNRAYEQYVKESKLALLHEQLERRKLAAELDDFVTELRHRTANEQPAIPGARG